MNPVVLEGRASAINPNVIVTLDPRSLQNKTSRPIRIDEIRVRVEWQTWLGVTGATISSQFAAYASGSMQLRIGNTPITGGVGGFVALPAVTWPKVDGGAENGTVYSNVSGDFAGWYIRFSKPVFLSPRQFISAQFVYTNIGPPPTPHPPDLGAPPDFVITVIGREVDDAHGGYTPWLGSWRPPMHTDGTGNFIDISTSADLVNAFADDMFVERLIGRVLYNPSSTVFASPPMPEEFGGIVGVNASTDQIRVRIEDHHATQIVRDAAPFKHVFDFVQRSWVVNSTLPSKGFYKVTVESNLAAAASAAYTLQPYVGMLGYRKVR